MPSLPDTDRAAKCVRPVATSASHPSAAAASVPNCAATNSATRRDESAADDGRTMERIGRPSGTSGTSARPSSSPNSLSGGAHTRTSAPRARNRTASPAIGSTSPRDPYVDNSTRTSRLHFRSFRPRPAIMRHDPGLAASPPVRYRLKVEGSECSSFPLIIRCGPAVSPPLIVRCGRQSRREPEMLAAGQSSQAIARQFLIRTRAVTEHVSRAGAGRVRQPRRPRPQGREVPPPRPAKDSTSSAPSGDGQPGGPAIACREETSPRNGNDCQGLPAPAH